ncbi:MAG: metallophosphoesterase, partial [candidate division KSB1 bacterium]
ASARAWQEFDRTFAPLFATGARFIPLLGNHDYWGAARLRHAHLLARFPRLQQEAWRAEIYHGLGLVCIDSNRGQYARGDWARQERWFEETLQKLTENPSVAAILVFSHHPPFTNSAVLRRADFLEQVFLPAFFSSSKAKAFISGHVHGYEHFVREGKDFIVSGGGGGPRLPLRRVERRQFVDRSALAEPRPFHYLLLHCATQQLRLEAWGMQKGETRAGRFDEIVMPLDSALTS